MTKQERLNALATKIIENQTTPALAAGAIQLVMGEGNPDADIVFIGEAPGAKEDQQGRPFIGAAGKFLDTMLASINLDRSDVYITNIVKYRPPKNRDPSKAEIAEFKPYLYEQLQIIEPKLVIFLGRHSMNVFFPELKISEAHGQPFEHEGQMYMPLYHPAAALYNGSLRSSLLEDFSRIPAVTNKIK